MIVVTIVIAVMIVLTIVIAVMIVIIVILVILILMIVTIVIIVTLVNIVIHTSNNSNNKYDKSNDNSNNHSYDKRAAMNGLSLHAQGCSILQSFRCKQVASIPVSVNSLDSWIIWYVCVYIYIYIYTCIHTHTHSIIWYTINWYILYSVLLYCNNRKGGQGRRPLWYNILLLYDLQFIFYFTLYFTSSCIHYTV